MIRGLGNGQCFRAHQNIHLRTIRRSVCCYRPQYSLDVTVFDHTLEPVHVTEERGHEGISWFKVDFIGRSDLPDTTTGQRCWKLDDSGLRLTRTVAQGYGGGIDILLTQDAGQLRGLRITAHQETPGIADFLNRYDEGWLSNLTGRTSMELTALDTVTGATITSRAMLDTLITALNTEDAACTP